MPGKFEIKTAKNGKVHFNLKASNGQIILTSEKYESRSAAMKGIESVRKNAGNEKRFERKDAKDGSSYFVLKAANGEVIGKIPDHFGALVILVDHDMSLVSACCQTTAVLDFGKLIASGPTREVLRNEHVIRAYLGTEETL